jgi:hypothetical protein
MICPYCKRELHPWPIVRPGGCAPKDWKNCIRTDLTMVPKLKRS